MSESVCVACRKPKAAFECEICGDASCKKCGQVLPENAFSFLPEIPPELKHTYYCGHCYDQEVAPQMDAYQDTMEKAKQVLIFFTTQKKGIPLIRQEREPIRIPECDDRDETILRLAFQAALQDHNAVIEVEVSAEKIRHHAYQTSKWSGRGIAATVNAAKMADYE